MLHFSPDKINEMPARYRANLINSCTGYKSCNLLATISDGGRTNLAIFNSVVHIGSNPPMLGFILRPLTVRRDTYANFKANGYFTVNQVAEDMISDAHKTGAKYGENSSEFEHTGLTPCYLNDFPAPFVEESPIKIACKYRNEYTIEENGCLLIIGAIEHIYLPGEAIHEDGWVQLDKTHAVSTIGLDGYALPKVLDRFAYPRPEDAVKSIFDGT